MKRTCLLILMAGIIYPVMADEEMANQAHVAAAEGGRCYAKSVPSQPSGQVGATKVYSVGTSEDTLVHTLAWYSREIYLLCGVGPKYAISVVQMGPWARGRYANADDLALAFFYDGKPARRYSTVEIGGTTDNVKSTKSHYTVIRRVNGFRFKGSNQVVFEVETEDGRTLAFDPVTGGLVTAN